MDLTERIGRKTGGLSVYPYTSAVRGKPNEPVAYVMFRGKAMGDKSQDLLALVQVRDEYASSAQSLRDRGGCLPTEHSPVPPFRP